MRFGMRWFNTFQIIFKSLLLIGPVWIKLDVRSHSLEDNITSLLDLTFRSSNSFMDLIDLLLSGRNFTWFQRNESVASHLDNNLVHDDWLDQLVETSHWNLSKDVFGRFLLNTCYLNKL